MELEPAVAGDTGISAFSAHAPTLRYVWWRFVNTLGMLTRRYITATGFEHLTKSLPMEIADIEAVMKKR